MLIANNTRRFRSDNDSIFPCRILTLISTHSKTMLMHISRSVSMMGNDNSETRQGKVPVMNRTKLMMYDTSM
jgi:hypothetical protein